MKIFKIILLVIVFIVIAKISSNIVKSIIYKDKVIGGGYFAIKDIEEYSADASMTLMEALAGSYTWDQLPLTDQFKEKYKDRKAIINDIYDFEDIGCIATDQNGEEMIMILGDKPDNILTDIILPSITTIYLFRYKVVDGKLDDVELVEKYDTDAMTGTRLFGKDDDVGFGA